MWNRARTARCSRCGIQLAVPSQERVIRCASCNSITNFGNTHGPIWRAMGLAKSVMTNISDSIRSLSPSTGSNVVSSGYNYPVSLPASFPRVKGNKRALLIGITYISTKYELKGSVNDVSCMRYLLHERFDFPDECILVLTEEERDPYRIPTKENIRAAMRWLVTGCEPGDALVFHFSGHGVQRLDPSGDEVDGYDEALCPLDFESNGTIVDDEINASLVQPLPQGVKLHAIVDACHSGTILDLPFLCRMSRGGSYQWENHKPPLGIYNGEKGLAILISGCDDNQTSADTSAFSGTTSTGAMTYSFIQAIETHPDATYGTLLLAMRSAIRDANTGIRLGGPIASLIRKVYNFGLKQEPQLSSSEKFDIYNTRFRLSF